MFHLSLPDEHLAECIGFYRECFEAEVVVLAPGVVNLFVFGGQLTLHERQDSALTDAARTAINFGAVLPANEWLAARERLADRDVRFDWLVEPGGPGTRGKLVVRDPSDNLVELNTEI